MRRVLFDFALIAVIVSFFMFAAYLAPASYLQLFRPSWLFH
jgi:hypothetical protein